MENQNNTSNEQITEALKKAGITCKSCWWQEGGRCYKEPCERIPNPDGIGSISTKMANEVCSEHSSKRKVLEQFFPPDMLVIASELNGKK
jgi:hypothetical protein